MPFQQKTGIDQRQKFRKYLQAKEFTKRFPEVRLNIMGDYAKFPKDLVTNASQTTQQTQNNTKYVLNLCINYSGQDELVMAVNNIISSGIQKVNRQTIEDNLYTKGQPPLDFVVRTSGEQRLSNFMLWQISYAELYFPKTHWPAFKKKQLFVALKEYQNRDRRFGAIKE